MKHTTKEHNMPEEKTLAFAEWHAALKEVLYGTAVTQS